jgi:ribosomal protein S27AE
LSRRLYKRKMAEPGEAKTMEGKSGVTGEDIIDYYLESHLEDARMAGDDLKQELTKKIREHMYGEGSTRPFIIVDWNRLFDENKCPNCDDLISLKENTYECGKCGLDIPVELYDKAKEQHELEMSLIKKRREFAKKIEESGLSTDRLDELYSKALALASSKLSEEGKNKENGET